MEGEEEEETCLTVEVIYLAELVGQLKVDFPVEWVVRGFRPLVEEPGATWGLSLALTENKRNIL